MIPWWLGVKTVNLCNNSNNRKYSKKLSLSTRLILDSNTGMIVPSISHDVKVRNFLMQDLRSPPLVLRFSSVNTKTTVFL